MPPRSADRSADRPGSGPAPRSAARKADRAAAAPSDRPALPLRPAAHYHFLAETLATLEGAVRHGLAGSRFIPDDWQAVALHEPTPEKTQLSLRIDSDVADFFRLMGRGWRSKMNRVLRAFMHARLSGVLKGPEDQTHAPTAEERYAMGAHALAELGFRINRRKAAGFDTLPEELDEERGWLELDRLADEIGLGPQDRLHRPQPAGA